MTKEIKHQICGDGFIQYHPVKTLAQPEQEPVAVVDSTISGHIDWLCTFFPKQGTKLYTTPPPVGFAVMQKPWVGLTDEERMEIYNEPLTITSCMKAVEAKLKEKNT